MQRSGVEPHDLHVLLVDDELLSRLVVGEYKGAGRAIGGAALIERACKSASSRRLWRRATGAGGGAFPLATPPPTLA